MYNVVPFCNLFSYRFSEQPIYDFSVSLNDFMFNSYHVQAVVFLTKAQRAGTAVVATQSEGRGFDPRSRHNCRYLRQYVFL